MSVPVPLLSVIVPIHNVASYLWTCLESLAAQELTDLEVILVDDGSTDNSGLLARRFAARDPRFRLLHNAQPKGPSAARNQGAAAARGRFIAFVDADDVVLPAAYATMVAALTASGSSYATGGVQRLLGQNRRVSPLHDGLHEIDQRGVDVRAAPRLIRDTTGWNKVFRRDFYHDVVGPWPEGMIYEDIAPMLRALVRARGIDICRGTVYLWRQREDGSSLTQNRDNIASLQDRLGALDDARAEIDRSAPDLRDLLMWKILTVDLRLFLTGYHRNSPDWRSAVMTRARTLLSTMTELHLAELHPAWCALYGLIAQERLAEAEAILLDSRPVEAQFRLRDTPTGVQAEWRGGAGKGGWVQGRWHPVPNWLPDPQPALTVTPLRICISSSDGLLLRGTVALGPMPLHRSPAPMLEMQIRSGARILHRSPVRPEATGSGLDALVQAGPEIRQAVTLHLPMDLLQDLARHQPGALSLDLVCRFGDETMRARLQADRPAARPHGNWAPILDAERPVGDQLGIAVSADIDGALALYLQRPHLPPPPPAPPPPLAAPLPPPAPRIGRAGWRKLARLLRGRRKAAPPQAVSPTPQVLPAAAAPPVPPRRYQVRCGFAETGFLLQIDPPLPDRPAAGSINTESAAIMAHLVALDRPGLVIPIAADPAHPGTLWLDLRRMARPDGTGILPPGRYDILDPAGKAILLAELAGPSVIWLGDLRHEITRTRDRLQLLVRSHAPGHFLPEPLLRERRLAWPASVSTETGDVAGIDPRPLLLLESAGGRCIGRRPLAVLRALAALGGDLQVVFVEAHAAARSPDDLPPGILRVRRSSAQYWQAMHRAAALVTDGALPPGVLARPGLCILQTGTGFEVVPEDLPLSEAALWDGLIAPSATFEQQMARQSGFCGTCLIQPPAWAGMPTGGDLAQAPPLMLLRDRASLALPGLKPLAASRPEAAIRLVALGGRLPETFLRIFRPGLHPALLECSDTPELAALLARSGTVISDIAPLCQALRAMGREALDVAELTADPGTARLLATRARRDADPASGPDSTLLLQEAALWLHARLFAKS